MYLSSNFRFLARYSTTAVTIASDAEACIHHDPISAIAKLRCFVEFLCRDALAYYGISLNSDKLADMQNTLYRRELIDRRLRDIINNIRQLGNRAVHDYQGSKGEALHILKLALQVAIWFYKVRGPESGWAAPSFTHPPDTQAERQQRIAQLQQEKDRIKAEKQRLEKAKQLLLKASETQKEQKAQANARAEDLETQNQELRQEQEATLQLALDREAELLQYIEEMEAEAQTLESKLEQWRQKHTDAHIVKGHEAVSQFELMARALPAQQPDDQTQKNQLARAKKAAEEVDLDEESTRRIIDAQLIAAGWQADTQKLRYSKGTRPEKNTHKAIAEWPTTSGPADYILFVGLTPVAAVEAKRYNTDVEGVLPQAIRYAESFELDETHKPAGDWKTFKLPFAFSTNGRPYFKQFRSKSGIWFRDLRHTKKYPLKDWPSPEGLMERLKRHIGEANTRLEQNPLDIHWMRDYQKEAVEAVEKAIAEGQTSIMLSMATGTGKTRTCLALIHRLLKYNRFRRILFLVDRTTLGEQAFEAFSSVPLDVQQKLNQDYHVLSLKEQLPETATRLHLATVQSLIRRLELTADDPEREVALQRLTVDTYDCIIVDECHRGYNEDREMSEAEELYMDQNLYEAKYRAAMDYFDAVKIGLTATPALHTVNIFGQPVFSYPYRRAVLEGYLVDHRTPVSCKTELSENGITVKAGETMPVYDTGTQTMEAETLAEDVTWEIEDFNRQVITESFNRVVCQWLASKIEPDLGGKTLIFCVNNTHADLVVRLLTEAYETDGLSLAENAIIKITAAVDQYPKWVRHFKNEQNPSIVVTVDLLTTGIDVPEITNLVFLRRVRSRILYEQMLGRATRLCPEIDKEDFGIYDAVNLYKALEPVSKMPAVAPNPQVGFGDMAELLRKHPNSGSDLKDKFVARLRRKAKKIKEKYSEGFAALAGMDDPKDLADQILQMDTQTFTQWVDQHPDLIALLDQKITRGNRQYISNAEDRYLGETTGYGDNQKPGDYLQEFADFVRDNPNQIAAIKVVTTRPGDLTHADLKQLLQELDDAGFSKNRLREAWRNERNEDVVASIIGFVRQAALGDPMLSDEERLASAKRRILSTKNWNTKQRQWLDRIFKDLGRNAPVLDREILDNGEYKNRGGFKRLDKVFDKELAQLITQINEAIWDQSA